MSTFSDWKLLRIKDDTANDPDWADTQVDPNSFLLTVGGTASNGNYTVNIVPVDPTRSTVTNTFNRAGGETNAQIADQVEQLLTADLAAGGTLDDYLESATDDGAGVITVIVHPNAPPFTVTTSAPGAGTLTVSPDDTFPITRVGKFFRGQLGDMSRLEVAFIPIDSSGNPLEDDNGMTFNVEILDTIIRASQPIGIRGAPLTSDTYAVGVTSSTTSTAHAVNDKLTVEMNGSTRFGVRLDTLTNTPTGYDALEIWVREAIA